MPKNHGLSYMGPGEVVVLEIDYPGLALGNRKCDHGVIGGPHNLSITQLTAHPFSCRAWSTNPP